MGEQTIHYLDHAAATPCDERVVKAMSPYLTEVFYNPSASYSGGIKAKNALNKARDDIARVLGAKPNDIIFTAGATESINLAINGILSSGGHAVISAVEHPAVREAIIGRPHTILPVSKKGLVDPISVASAITDETCLVSVTMADNEFGTVQDIAGISREIERVRLDRRSRNIKTPIFFHSDGSQAASFLDIKVSRLGVDMLTLNAAKCYGPKQVGLLWVKSNVVLEPLLRGGGQERGLRSGTENVAGAVGFALALRLAQDHRHSENTRLNDMRTRLMNILLEKVPGIVIDGHPKKHLPGHLHVHVDGLDAERVVFHLDNKKAYIATGAACAANKSTRSPSLEAIGLSPDEADGSLRITLGRLNDIEDVEYLADAIAEAINTEREL